MTTSEDINLELDRDDLEGWCTQFDAFALQDRQVHPPDFMTHSADLAGSFLVGLNGRIFFVSVVDWGWEPDGHSHSSEDEDPHGFSTTDTTIVDIGGREVVADSIAEEHDETWRYQGLAALVADAAKTNGFMGEDDFSRLKEVFDEFGIL